MVDGPGEEPEQAQDGADRAVRPGRGSERHNHRGRAQQVGDKLRRPDRLVVADEDAQELLDGERECHGLPLSPGGCRRPRRRGTRGLSGHRPADSPPAGPSLVSRRMVARWVPPRQREVNVGRGGRGRLCNRRPGSRHNRPKTAVTRRPARPTRAFFGQTAPFPASEQASSARCAGAEPGQRRGLHANTHPGAPWRHGIS